MQVFLCCREYVKGQNGTSLILICRMNNASEGCGAFDPVKNKGRKDRRK